MGISPLQQLQFGGQYSPDLRSGMTNTLAQRNHVNFQVGGNQNTGVSAPAWGLPSPTNPNPGQMAPPQPGKPTYTGAPVQRQQPGAPPSSLGQLQVPNLTGENWAQPGNPLQAPNQQGGGQPGMGGFMQMLMQYLQRSMGTQSINPGGANANQLMQGFHGQQGGMYGSPYGMFGDLFSSMPQFNMNQSPLGQFGGGGLGALGAQPANPFSNGMIAGL